MVASGDDNSDLQAVEVTDADIVDFSSVRRLGKMSASKNVGICIAQSLTRRPGIVRKTAQQISEV